MKEMMQNKKIHEEANTIKDDDEEEIYVVQEMHDFSRIKNRHGEVKVSMHKKDDNFKINTR